MAYASVHIRALDPELSVNLIVPIDTLYLFDHTTWIWYHGEKDAFPAGFSFFKHNPHENSFRTKARLFDGLEEIEKNKIYDFRKCQREDYQKLLENLKL
jgi:hypothetical protein